MILDGKKVSEKILEKVSEKVSEMLHKPHLVAILVGEDPASKIYVRNKKIAAERVGIKTTIINLPVTTKEEDLLIQIN